MKSFQKIDVNPLTYILILLILACGLFKYLSIIILIMVFHELGHITLALVFKKNISKISVYPTGALMKLDIPISSNIYEDLLVSASGIFFQLILSLIMNIINPEFIDTFNYYNKIIILFNMSPIYPLDGFNILRLLLDLLIPFKWSLKLSAFISFISIIVFIVFFRDVLYSNILVLIFIIVMNFRCIKLLPYTLYRFYLERMLGTFNFAKKKNISKISHMYKNRENILAGKKEREFLQNLFSK